jgi:hypothetical protein
VNLRPKKFLKQEKTAQPENFEKKTVYLRLEKVLEDLKQTEK